MKKRDLQSSGVLANQSLEPSRVIGRSRDAIFEMGEELERSLLSPQPRASLETSVASATNVLTIPTVHFAEPLPALFRFGGYPAISQADAPFPAGHLQPSQDTHLDIPAVQQGLIEQTETLVKFFRGDDSVNAFSRFACAFSDAAEDASMADVLEFLTRMVQKAPEDVPRVMGLLTGARMYHQDEFSKVIERVVRTGALGRQAGTEMDAAHLCTTFATTLLDDEIFTTSLSQTASVASHRWRVLYVALRSGDFAAADATAPKLSFPAGTTDHTPIHVLETWYDKGGNLPLDLMTEMVSLCEYLMQSPKKLSVNDLYLIRCICCLCGQFQLMEDLIRKTEAVWDSIDEYIWFLLVCVRRSAAGVESGTFSLEQIQEAVGKQILRAKTTPAHKLSALLSTLQFKKAVKYIMGLKGDHQRWFVYGVHLIVALEFMGMLDLGGDLDEESFSRKQMAEILTNFAAGFLNVDSKKYFQYRFFANKLASKTPQTLEDSMFDTIIEYLLQDKRPSKGLQKCSWMKDCVGVSLSPEVFQMIRSHASRTLDKNQLFKDVAKRLKDKGHLDEAYRCYKAGEYFQEALETVSQLVLVSFFSLLLTAVWQISEKLGDMYTEKLMEREDKFVEMRHSVAVLLDQVHVLYTAISPTLYVHAPHIRELHNQAEMLKRVFGIVVHFHDSSFQEVVDDFESLSFIPKQDTDIQRCIRQLTQSLPLILSILHKIVSLFCNSVVLLSKSSTPQSGHQFRRYQEFVRQLPSNYSFKSQITAKLAATVTALANI